MSNVASETLETKQKIGAQTAKRCCCCVLFLLYCSSSCCCCRCCCCCCCSCCCCCCVVVVVVVVVLVLVVVVVVVVTWPVGRGPLFFHLLPLRVPPCIGRGRRIYIYISTCLESFAEFTSIYCRIIGSHWFARVQPRLTLMRRDRMAFHDFEDPLGGLLRISRILPVCRKCLLNTFWNFQWHFITHLCDVPREEHPICFVPSYKWHPGTDAYDMRSQKHVPVGGPSRRCCAKVAQKYSDVKLFQINNYCTRYDKPFESFWCQAVWREGLLCSWLSNQIPSATTWCLNFFAVDIELPICTVSKGHTIGSNVAYTYESSLFSENWLKCVGFV